MIRDARRACAAAILVLVAAALLEACGDGEKTAPTQTASQPPSTPTATASAATPATTPGAPLTLTIASILPKPAKVGDSVTITFETRAGAVIGFQITDPQGQTAAQTLVTAGSDGTATYELTIDGPPGTWLVEAAAGASIADLLRLQASPSPGPQTADATFEVQ